MRRYSAVKVLTLLILGMLVVSACTQTYSQAPLATPTLISTGLFVSPFPSGQDPLQIVADLGTQTAVAKTAQAAGTTTPSTEMATTGTPATPTQTSLSASATLGTGVTAAATTPAAATVVPVTKTATPQATVIPPTTSVGRPTSYTLQTGEFPYCIARRFNLNPDDLLSMNNITDGAVFYPGRTLTIPQTGSWPGDRSLHNHPDTYTVDSSDTTIYGVACYYGDVLPQTIASANGLTLSSALTVGQRLTIP
jgi:LysM repeat protein